MTEIEHQIDFAKANELLKRLRVQRSASTVANQSEVIGGFSASERQAIYDFMEARWDQMCLAAQKVFLLEENPSNNDPGYFALRIRLLGRTMGGNLQSISKTSKE